jgi:hypothetical protein
MIAEVKGIAERPRLAPWLYYCAALQPTSLASGFDANMTDPADDVVCGFPTFFHRQHIDGVGLIVRAQDQLTGCNFHIFNRTSVAFIDGIHIRFAFSIRLERVVVTIDEEGGAGQKTRVHAHTFAGINLNEDKAFPAVTGGLHGRAEAAQESFLELQYVLYVHAGDKGFGSGHGAFDQENVLKLVFGGRHDGGAFVDFGGIEKVKDGEMLHFEDPVHAFDAEATFAIEEIGDMSLSKTGLCSQTQAGQFSISDAQPQDLAEIVLKRFEFHGFESISCL